MKEVEIKADLTSEMSPEEFSSSLTSVSERTDLSEVTEPPDTGLMLRPCGVRATGLLGSPDGVIPAPQNGQNILVFTEDVKT